MQSLDISRTREDGIQRDVLALAKEIVEFQNNLVNMMVLDSLAFQRQSSRLIEKYPRFMEFNANRTTAYLETVQNPSAAKASAKSHPCGNYEFPVPSSNPKRWQYSTKDPRKVLTELGFHLTAGYACGARAPFCASDYTRGR